MQIISEFLNFAFTSWASSDPNELISRTPSGNTFFLKAAWSITSINLYVASWSCRRDYGARNIETNLSHVFQEVINSFFHPIFDVTTTFMFPQYTTSIYTDRRRCVSIILLSSHNYLLSLSTTTAYRHRSQTRSRPL